MPMRIPKHSVVIQREGVNMIPPVGKPFNFSEQEIKDVQSVAPDALRKPINEGNPEEPFLNTGTKSNATATGKGGKGGKDEEL